MTVGEPFDAPANPLFVEAKRAFRLTAREDAEIVCYTGIDLDRSDMRVLYIGVDMLKVVAEMNEMGA